MKLRLAVATEDFGQPLRQAITQAAVHKVKGLRLNARTEVRAEEFSDTALRQLKHYVHEHQLQVAGLMFSSRHAIYEQQHLDQRLDAIRSAMTLVRKLGTSELLVRVGRIPDPESASPETRPNRPANDDVDSLTNPFSFAPAASSSIHSGGQSDAQKFELLSEILNDLANFGNHHGAVLQLQFSSFDTDRIVKLVSRITNGPVKVVYDPATCVMSGSNPVRIFRDLYHDIGYVRLRDAQKDVDGGGVEVPFGEGVVDWTELLPTIVEAHLDGWVCVERTGGDQRDEDVVSGLRQISQLLPSAG